MKKILLASTMLLSSAAMAAADVTISGQGRFGVSYEEDRASDGIAREETVIHHRLRFNIDASTETDTGVTFGGRIRIQNASADTDISGSTVNTAYVYTSFGGLRVEVGNANTALDSTGLFAATDMGLLDDSFYDKEEYASYSSTGIDNRQTGIFVSYGIGDLSLRASYLQQDQYELNNNVDEWQVAAEYTFGQFSVAAGHAKNAGFNEDLDQTYVGLAYALNDATQIGLIYGDEGSTTGATGFDRGETVTLYGTYSMDAWTFRGYVANNDGQINIGTSDDPDIVANVDDTIYGLGADYDLGGGAAIRGSVQTTYEGDTLADLGVRFNF